MRKYSAICAGNIPKEAANRLSEAAEVILLPEDAALPRPVRFHPDMILTVFRGVLYCRKSYYENNTALIDKICASSALNVCPCDVPAGDYPLDAALNALVLEDRDIVIGRKNSLAKPLRDICTVNTNQGYAACSALYAAGHIVTADPSIAKAANSACIPCRLIPAGGIELPGYNMGFVGGCCGVLGSTVYAFGNPRLSPSGKSLASFCRDFSLTLVPLSDTVLTDYGGIKLVPADD